jgi:hypothetical protein
MHRRTYLLVTMVLIFASFVLGCGSGGGSGSGGSSTTTTATTTATTTVAPTNSLVGTWDVTGGTVPERPDVVTFNAGGTGSLSGTATGSNTFTWSVSGNTLNITVSGGSADTMTITWTDSNNVTLTNPPGSRPSSGTSITLRRR